MDRSTALPLYQQIYEVLRRRILAGELAPGAALPSERKLSAQLHVDRITLRQALQRLVKDRLIRRNRGVGTFVEDPSRRCAASQRLQVGILLWQHERLWETGCCGYMKDVYGQLTASAASLGLGVYTPSLRHGWNELADAVRSGRIQGVISLPFAGKAGMDFLTQLDLPKILLDRRERCPGLDNVIIDSHPGVYQGVTELIRLGHCRITYVGALVADHEHSGKGPLRYRMAGDSADRFRAYRQALADAAIDYQPDWFVEIDYREESAAELARRIATGRQRPTALLVFDDELAIRVQRALETAGLSVPRNISVLGFGNSISEAHSGDLATVAVDYEQMVETAVRRVYERMTQGGLAGQVFLISSRFKPGGSIGAPSRR